LREIEPGNGTKLVASLGQAKCRLLRVQRRLRDLHRRLIGGNREIGVRDLRDEAELHRAAHFLLREILLQRGVREVSHAAEEIQLEVGDTQRDAIDVERGVVVAAAADAAGACAEGQCRQPVGALDLVLRAQPLDVQCGDPQVAIALQRLGDQRCERGVHEKITPADIGGRARAPRVGLRGPFG
jgi:hypothetical protein